MSTPTGTAAFWRYWIAGTASSAGEAITTVALPLTAIGVLDASTFQVALVAAAGSAAWLLIGLPAGVIVRHLPLRGTLMAMDLIRAAAILTVPFAWWAGVLNLVHLAAVALVVNLATVVFDVGNMTFIPSVVPKEELTRRNSLMSGTGSTVDLAGPGVGGLLVQLLGAVPTLIVDVVSYVFSAAIMRSLPRPPRVPFRAAEPIGRQIGEGWRFVVGHPIMRPCMTSATVINLVCGGITALAPVYLVRTLGASPGVVGLLLASEGVGALAGAAATPRAVARFGSARTSIVAVVLGVAFALLLPFGEGLLGMVLFTVGNAGLALTVVTFSITTRTHRQVASPPDLLGRVLATVRFVSWGAIPVGAFASGLVASATGSTRAALGVLVGILVLAPLVLVASPVRGLHELADAEESAAVPDPVDS